MVLIDPPGQIEHEKVDMLSKSFVNVCQVVQIRPGNRGERGNQGQVILLRASFPIYLGQTCLNFCKAVAASRSIANTVVQFLRRAVNRYLKKEKRSPCQARGR